MASKPYWLRYFFTWDIIMFIAYIWCIFVSFVHPYFEYFSHTAQPYLASDWGYLIKTRLRYWMYHWRTEFNNSFFSLIMGIVLLFSLGPLVNKVKEYQVETIVDTLCNNMVSEKEQLRDISSIGKFGEMTNHW